MRNYYKGWTIQQLLDERLMLQKALSTGRTTEVRLANETVKNEDSGATPLEVSLLRVEYALYILDPATYPLENRSSVTIQRFY